ncbi:MAG: GNAT family N-acetyltransferase [Longimicrobiales bacterium]
MVRPFTLDDWPAVRAIYAEAIHSGDATFETAPPERAAWDAAHLAEPRLVAEATGEVLGWAALSRVSERAVYAGVAEVSVYVAATARGRGVGSALLEALVSASERAGIWTLQAGIFPENGPSLAMHGRAGFRRVGFRERAGKDASRWRDVILLERRSRSVGTGPSLPPAAPHGWPLLRTARLRLDAPTVADVPTIQRLANDVDVARNTLSFPHPYGPGEAERFLTRLYREYALGDAVGFAIRAADSGEYMGAIGLHLVRSNSAAEAGYWIGQPYRGRGYASEGLAAVLDFAFRDLGLHRVHASHFARNPASGQVMRKAGMRQEGTARGAVRKFGVFEDLIRYAALSEDFGSDAGTRGGRLVSEG